MVKAMIRRNSLLLISLMIFILAAVGVGFAAERIERRLERVVIEQLEVIAEETSVTLDYDQLHIMLFSSIELTNVRLGFNTPEGNLEVLRTKRFTFSFQLFNYLFSSGRKDLEFAFSDTHIDLNPEKLDLVTAFAEYILDLMPPVENVYVRFNLDKTNIAYDQEQKLLASASAEDIAILFVNQELSVDVSEPVNASLTLEEDAPVSSLEVSMSPSFHLAPGGEIRLDLPGTNAAADDTSLAAIDLTISRTAADQMWRGAFKGGEFLGDVLLDTKGDYLSARFDGSDVEISKYLRFIEQFGLIQESPEISSGILSFTGKADYDFETSYLIYDGDLELEDVQAESLESTVNARFSFRGDQHHMTAEQLSGEFQDFSLTGNLSTDFDNLLNAAGRLKLYTPENEQPIADLQFRKAEDQLYTIVSTSLLNGFSAQGLTKITDDLVTLTGTLSYDSYDLDSSIEFSIPDKSLILRDAAGQLYLHGSQSDNGVMVVGSLNQFVLPVSRFLESRLPDIPADMRISGYVEDVSTWNFRLNDVRLRNVPVLDRMLDFDFSAAITPDTAQISELTLSDGSSTLNGQVSIFFDDASTELFANLAEQEEEYSFSGLFLDQSTEVDVTFTNASLDRLAPDQATGRVSGNLHLIQEHEDLVISGELQTVDSISLYEQPFSGAMKIDAEEDRISVQSDRLAIGEQEIADVSLFYRADEGLVTLRGSGEMEMDQRLITSEIVLDASLQPFHSLQDISFEKITDKPISYEVRTSGLSVNDESIPEWEGSGQFFDNQLSMTTGPQQQISITAKVETGEFTLDLRESDLPISMQLAGQVSDGKIYARSDNVFFDVQMFNALNMEFLTFNEGKARGSLIVTGVLDDLEYYGEVLSDSLSFTTKITTGEHTVSNLYISLVGKEIIFSPFVVETQDDLAQAQLSFFVDDIIPRSIDLSLSVPRDGLISVNQEFKGMRISYNGELAGDLRLFGFFDDLSIEGDIFLDRGTISRPPLEEGLPPAANSAITSVELTLESGKNLAGIFPNIDLPIIVARVTDGEIIRVDADIARQRFSIIGDVDIRGGEIVYFQRNFFIQDGTLNLNIDQNNVDPRVSLTARLKDFDSEGNKVDIYLNLDNDPVTQLDPSFTARPEKTLAEISQILGRNIIPTDILGTTDLTAALAFATLATDVIQQVGLIELDPIQELEVSIRNTLNLDLFSIRTMVFQNILLDTIPGEYSNSFTRNPIARYLDNTTLLMGKYIRDDMFIQAIIQLSIREEAGIGFFFTNDLGLDVEVSYEWDTPLYSLTLALQPESFSFNQLLNSLSLGVAWSFAF
jgi:hypothetical protein